jgi:hypothetical protein
MIIDLLINSIADQLHNKCLLANTATARLNHVCIDELVQGIDPTSQPNISGYMMVLKSSIV